MRVIWTPEALQDRIDIWDYLATDTLELIPHEHYRLVYEIESDTAWILALVHTSRQWPPVHQ